MSNVAVAPPDLKEADPKAVAVADYLRHHKLLKQRQSILNGKRSEFFRVKRAVRALLDPGYEKARKKKPLLPEITKREDALEAFRLLPLNRLAFRVAKMETEEAKKAGLKPVKGIPVVQVLPQQEFGDDMYYTWFYEPVPMITYVYAALAVIAIFGIILFPLWPVQLRIGVWYLSMGLVGLLCLFFAIAIVRLIIFVITWPLVKPGLWIFPNLFEDVGFVDSFIPLYAWHGVNSLPKSEKAKTNKKRNLGLSNGQAPLTAAGMAAGANGANQHQHQHSHGNQAPPPGTAGLGASPGGGPAGGPGGPAGGIPLNNPQALLQMKMQEAMGKARQRKEELIKSGNVPKSAQEMQELDRRLFTEEMTKVKNDLEQLKNLLERGQAQGAPQVAQAAQAAQAAPKVAGPQPPAPVSAEAAGTESSESTAVKSSPVTKRSVTLEDDE